MATEATRVAKEKAVAEARHVEEQRRAELEEQWRAMAAVKAWGEEAEGCQIVEELAAVVAERRKAILAVAETVGEEAETEQAVRLLTKQKGRVEGE